MTNLTRIDAVVMGAGPAGCAFAISAESAGLRTVLLESCPFPRHRPGETLHPGVQPLMAQLGCEQDFLNAGFPRFAGIHVEANGESRYNEFGSDEHGPWYGFQAWREEFDQILLNRCRAVGVQVLQPCRAIRPLLEGTRVAGVETTEGPLHARFTIDAAGSRHWLTKHLGLPIIEFSPKLIAYFGYSDGPQTESPLPCFIAGNSGWTWHAQVRDDLYHWTRLTVDARVSSASAAQKSAAEERGADVTWRCIEQPAGPGYFILGDAAAVLDPASSHGVLRALMSGIIAADVARRIPASPYDEARLTSGYCNWWKDWFRHDARQLRKWYREAGLEVAWDQPAPKYA